MVSFLWGRKIYACFIILRNASPCHLRSWRIFSAPESDSRRRISIKTQPDLQRGIFMSTTISCVLEEVLWSHSHCWVVTDAASSIVLPEEPGSKHWLYSMCIVVIFKSHSELDAWRGNKQPETRPSLREMQKITTIAKFALSISQERKNQGL